MERILDIDGNKYRALYSGRTARIYRDYFNQDMLEELDNAQSRAIGRLSQYADAGVKLDENGVLAILIKEVGAELLEKITWSAIASYQIKNNLEYKSYEEFIDDIDDYPSFLGICVSVYEMMIYGNRPIVEIIKEEANTDKKKQNTKVKTLHH